jgi:hypothetical protein
MPPRVQAAFLIALSTLSLTALAIVPQAAHANVDSSIYEHVADVSSTEHKALVLARKLKEKTPNNTMDYRVAKKAFGSSSRSVNWRRQYAAGWKLGGGKIAHVSKAELKKIEKVRKSPSRPFHTRTRTSLPVWARAGTRSSIPLSMTTTTSTISTPARQTMCCVTSRGAWVVPD